MKEKKINIDGGFFVAVEGIDGTGKTTLTGSLDWLLSEYFNVHITKEPSDTGYGKILRESFENGRLSPDEELDLFVKDRENHIKDVINPFLNKGYITITDRYFFSNIAYQGAYGIPVENVKRRNNDFPLPDIVLYIDLDINTALERISISRGLTNKVETENNITKVKKIFEDLKSEYAMFKTIDGNMNRYDIDRQAIRFILEGIKVKYSQNKILQSKIDEITNVIID